MVQKVLELRDRHHYNPQEIKNPRSKRNFRDSKVMAPRKKEVKI